MSRQHYAPHAVHMTPIELAKRLTRHWLTLGKLCEWWEPASAPVILREVCGVCFCFAIESMNAAELAFCHLAIIDAQPRPIRPYPQEGDVIEAACLAMIAVAESGGWAVSLMNGANGVLHG